MPELLDRREIADKGETRPQGNGQPQEMLAEFHTELARRHGLRVKLHSRRPFALELPLDPHEYFRIDRLRTGVTTEEPTPDSRHEKQRVGRNDQQDSQINRILRPEHHTENIKLPLDKVEEDGLAAVPVAPAQAIKQGLGKANHDPAPIIENSFYTTRVNRLVLLIQPV